jgi:cyanate permease
MKKLRQIHTYLGVFFAPLLLFFVITGWYQTMHPDRRKSPEEAEAYWDRARSVHADSVLPNPKAESYSTKPFRYFTVAMAVGFIVTTLVGIILAFKFTKNKWAILVSLIFGLVVPLAMLFLAQKK